MNKKDKIFLVLLVLGVLAFMFWWSYKTDKALKKYEERCNKIGWEICEAEAGLKTK